MSKAKSNFLLKGGLFQDSYAPNSAFNFVLDPVMHGLSIELDHDPVINIRRPDGVFRQIRLSREEDGIYRGAFTDTYLPGVYAAETEVFSTSPMNFKCTRYKYFTGVITRKPQSTGQPEDRDNSGTVKLIRCCEELKKIMIEMNDRRDKQ